MTDEYRAVDEYIAGLEDASGIGDAIVSWMFGECPCTYCGGSGYATTLDGESLGPCTECAGSGEA